jgi:DNA-binding transcriptional ArsR family regulator
MSTQAPELIAWLRAAGEPSRLRLLALCDRGDLSVSDLAQALGQSEPRVCRHLRILSEAGLIERLRNGQWVHYRIATSAPAASFVKGLLAQVDRSDPIFARDLDRAMSESAAVADAAGESRLGRALRDFVEHNAPLAQVGAGQVGSAQGGSARVGSSQTGLRAGAARVESAQVGSADVGSRHAGSALVVGVEHLELLEVAASLASGCTAIAHSRRAAQTARAFAERRGFNCRVMLAAGSEGLSDRDLTRVGQSFDLVILDKLAVNSEFSKLLTYGCRALAPRGWLCLFERYESLELSRGKIVEHPIARLRRSLGDVGLSCERLSPIEADDEHVLAAVAAPTVHREQLRHA